MGPTVKPTNETGISKESFSTLKFFDVTKDPLAGGQLVDTQRFPDLRFISASPNLVIRNLKDVTIEERKVSRPVEGDYTVWTFGVSLEQADAARLRSMTEARVSKIVLIVVDDEPVSAPTIMVPLETGTFNIDCTDRLVMEKIRKQLTEMKRGR